MKILLAEDDESVAFITQMSLETMGGHVVEIVADGESAVEAAQSTHFDLIILDGMMPKLSGLQAALKIRGHGLTSTPILFLSARSDEAEITKFLSVGNGYIAKPFDPNTICQAIEQELARMSHIGAASS